MGFSIKELTYKGKYLIYLSEQELTGPWFSFKLKGAKIGIIPVILKSIESTPIYNLVNTRTGIALSRITLDFNITEYLKKLVREHKLKSIPNEEKQFVRVYKDIFNPPHIPYINTFFTIKNISDYSLKDFSIYFVFDFDINGLAGYDNDMSGYDQENDIIYQYDETGLYGGFSPISKSTNYESCLTKDFAINQNSMSLSNTLYKGQGELLSALQIKFMTLEPNHTFQTALVISGGFSKEELIENIKEGKNNAMKHLHQVNRSVKSKQRNTQEEAFIKINLQHSEDCK
ncbi:MAG: hypothetical protein ACFFCE_09695 [Promethearchaeota archaeon]